MSEYKQGKIMNNITENIVKDKTRNIINSVNTLSDKIPVNLIYGIAPGLRSSLRNLDEDIKEYLDKREMEKIKAGIKARTKIDECENYLQMAKNMRIAETDDIISELEELKKWLFLEAEASRTKKMNTLN